MLVLVVGDTHIPDRAVCVPPEFRKLLVPGKIEKVISVGNTSDPKTVKILHSITSEQHGVKGEFDRNTDLPLSTVVEAGQLRLGIVSGSTVIPSDDPEVMLTLARQLDVDIVLWGGSHELQTFELDGKFFVNPGSLTGAFTLNWSSEEISPTFCLLDIQGFVCTIFVYSLQDGQVRVEKLTYQKAQA